MGSNDRYLVHLDDTSWGLYKFPLHIVDVAANPHRAPGTLATFRSARESAGGVRVYGRVVHLAKDGRAVSDERNITSWFRVGMAAAPIVLFQALPSYWLSRFRYVGPAKDLRTAVTPTFDPETFLEKRRSQRSSLARHADSLKQKTWAIRYHRGNLLSALEGAKGKAKDLYETTVAGAEYAALGHGLYSLLEELADTLALLRTIQGKRATPSNFHDLHRDTARLDTALADILAAADWYEPFRLERANTAHAFATLVRSDTGTSDLRLWQHADTRIYAQSSPPVREASAHVDTLLRGSDLLVERLCKYMLGLFHPWDLVSFMQAHPSAPEVRHDLRVWVREISFSEDAEYNLGGWTLLNEDGSVQIALDERGAMVAPRPADDTET